MTVAVVTNPQVGDPDMGFSGLRHFGPALIHHMQLKIRSGTSTQNFMMVSTPSGYPFPLFRAHPNQKLRAK